MKVIRYNGLFEQQIIIYDIIIETVNNALQCSTVTILFILTSVVVQVHIYAYTEYWKQILIILASRAQTSPPWWTSEVEKCHFQWPAKRSIFIRQPQF